MLSRLIVIAVALVASSLPGALGAQDSSRARAGDTIGTKPGIAQPDVEKQARLARRGGGVRIGTWDVRGLSAPSGAAVSSTPAFEGYMRRGLDLHLAIEHSVGVWRRTQHVTQTSSGPLGSSQTTSTLETYVISQFTSLSFFPITRPEHRIEPYVKAGAGFALGIDDRTGDGGSLFSGSGMSLVPGYGLAGGTGVELRFSNALGLTLGGRYQWVRFFQDLGSRRSYEGFGADIGMTYRFQFR